MAPFDLAIVVPCYNESDRLPVAKFESFLSSYSNVAICFVNDASTDRTQEVLQEIKNTFPTQIKLLSNDNNLGKAESVRKGMLYTNKHVKATVYAYLDADLATSLEECYSLLQYLDDNIAFVFASRILKVGSVVERKFSRFVFGRIIATFISNILDMKVYDTQCGCKLFNAELIATLFEKPFISKWLFDVELFSRMIRCYGKDIVLTKMEEIPVKKWIDQGDSKVKLSYFFRLWYDLYLIRKSHHKGLTE